MENTQNMNVEKGACNCKMCQSVGWCPAGKWHKIIKIIILVIVLVFIGKMAFGGHGWDDKNKVISTIVVSGKGEVVVRPDIATVSFTVTEENLDVGIAQDTVNKTVAKVVDYAKAQGVAEKDIKTTGYNIYPRYDYVNSTAYPYYQGTRVLAGYDVTQSLEVKIRDLTKAGKIVSGLGEFGIKDMSGLNFSVDKQDQITKEARELAIADARADAEKIAKGLGVRLVKITAFSENGNYPIYYEKAMLSSAPRAQGGVADAVLPTGENTITSNVTVTYEIR
jgi:uncharacterized protein YggE